MKKVLLYTCDTNGFGHYSMIQKIYFLMKDVYDVHIILGGNYSKIHISNIPHTIIDGQLFSKKREDHIQEVITTYKPDILMVDYFPFGRYSIYKEILFLIENFKKSGGILTFSIMRDIQSGEKHIDADGLKRYNIILEEKLGVVNPKDFFLKFDEIVSYSYKNNLENYLQQKTIEMAIEGKIIDAVLVFGEKNIYDLASEYIFPPSVVSRIKYVGYLTHDLLSLPERKQDEQPYVLVSFGGNVFDMKLFLRILTRVSGLKDIHFKIILGVFIPKDQQKNIIHTFKKFDNMEFVDFGIHSLELMNNSQVFIGSGGYGTLLDIYAMRKPSVLFVNANKTVFHNYGEQAKRIKVFSGFCPINYSKECDSGFIKNLYQLYIGSKNLQYSQEVSLGKDTKKNLLQYLKEGRK